jgi:protein HOOK3
MEAAGETSLSTCLLQWVRSFDNAGGVDALTDLNDGLVLWAILRQIDPDYFTGELPEAEVNASSDWTRKWQNLKHVEKQVAMYYRDVCNEQEQVDAGSVPDLKAVAAERSERDLEKLIMTIIRVAMASPESNQKMAQRLMSLGRENAMLIANELRSMEEADYMEESEPVSRDESAYHSEQETTEDPKTNGSKVGAATYQDPLLEREEELLQAQATIDRLQASQSSALQQLQELRQDKERLQEAFDAYRSEIEIKGRKAAGDDAYKKLQRQADNDRAYIDDLENQLQSSRNAIENYERQVHRQKDESDQNQKLRDDLQLLRADNDDLNQKIRANENLKKKIQTLQEQEKANVTLREELKQANERLEELERLKQVQAGLEKEIIEKKGLIRNQEYQINELTTTRKHAEYDARTLAQKLQEARDRHDRDHDAIQELRAKLRESNLDDTTTARDEEEPTGSKNAAAAESQPKMLVPKNDENKHLVEKVTLLEQQLEAADARLKQASERSAALEERNQNVDSDAEIRRKVEQRVQEHENTITNLRKELEAKNQKPDAPATSQDMASLQRENHLMTTAWYDLSTRLQNNGVSLGRRRQEPKSWIGKQRALVGPGSSLVSFA